LVDLTLKDSTSLAPAARELGLTIQRTPLFTSAGGVGIAANPKVLRTAFSASVLQDGNTSDPIEIGSNHDHMVVIRVAQHMPVKTLTFDEAHDRLLVDVRQDQRAKTARHAADALLARADKGETLDALTASTSGTVQAAEGVTREATNLPQPLLEAGFRLPHPVAGKPPQIALAELGPDHYALIETTQVVDGDIKTLDPAARASLSEQLPQMRGALDARSYIDMLRSEFPVKIAEDRL
ncbi:MAG: peptidylprolyl isomerase, partial [Lysobacteraceae bacterium]